MIIFKTLFKTETKNKLIQLFNSIWLEKVYISNSFKLLDLIFLSSRMSVELLYGKTTLLGTESYIVRVYIFWVRTFREWKVLHGPITFSSYSDPNLTFLFFITSSNPLFNASKAWHLKFLCAFCFNSHFW